MKYALLLNDMREPNIENIQVVGVAKERQWFMDWYNQLLAPGPWKDGQWNKVFLPGSELEWFNPVVSIYSSNTYEGGIWHFSESEQPELKVGMRPVKGR